jgi:hypothetical protein
MLSLYKVVFIISPYYKEVIKSFVIEIRSWDSWGR